MTGLFLKRKHKQCITAIGMVICFMVSFLPVTSSWYMSLNGRVDLSRLVISARTMKNHLVEKSSGKEIARSIDNIFKELKFATGQVKMSKTSDKKGIRLVRIVPEYPVLNLISILKAYQDFFFLISYKNIIFQTHEFPPEHPPPEKMFVS